MKESHKFALYLVNRHERHFCYTLISKFPANSGFFVEMGPLFCVGSPYMGDVINFWTVLPGRGNRVAPSVLGSVLISVVTI